MNKVIDYAIWSYTDLEELQECVFRSLSDGWQPQGGVTISPKHLVYAQAMVRYAPDEAVTLETNIESSNFDTESFAYKLARTLKRQSR